MRSWFVTEFLKTARVTGCAVLVLLSGCNRQSNPVSGTIEVDEVHVASRSAGRVEKIFAWEGDSLKAGTPIVQLEASELKARRDLAAAQINTAEHDVEAQNAQLEFLKADAQRQQDLLKRNTVSPNEAERAMSAAKAQEKNIAAARARVEQARAQLADMDAQIQEMKIVAPTDSILEVLSVKVGDVLPANREVATLILPERLWVRVYVPEPWLGLIKLDENVRVRVDSYPRPRFRRRGRADQSQGGIYASQCADRRGPDQAGLWGEDPPG